MPTPYSLDLRKRVIEAYEAKEESLRQIAKCFCVSLSFVRDLTRRYRETQKGSNANLWASDQKKCDCAN